MTYAINMLQEFGIYKLFSKQIVIVQNKDLFKYDNLILRECLVQNEKVGIFLASLQTL